MPQTIRIRRGTKSQLAAYGTLALAEMGFCTDTGEIFIGNGTANILAGRVMSGTLASRPNASTQGRLYYVSSGASAGYLFLDDGTAWQRVNAQAFTDLTGSLDDIPDGTNYKRVGAADITSGHVNKVSDGTNTKTAAEIKTHIDDLIIHRKINDGGTASTDLWSAQKTKSEIFNAIRGMDWQDSVKTRNTAAPPGTPAIRDRYLIPAGATGAWTGKTGQIADWNGTTWDFVVPAAGYAVYVEDENKNYTYNISAVWVVTGGANQTVNAGSGLTGGGSGDIITIAANIDNSSIIYDSANGNRLMVSVVDGGTF